MRPWLSFQRKHIWYLSRLLSWDYSQVEELLPVVYSYQEVIPDLGDELILDSLQSIYGGLVTEVKSDRLKQTPTTCILTSGSRKAAN